VGWSPTQRAAGNLGTLGCTSTTVVTPNESVTFRAMRENDISLFHEWLQRRHVVEWWGRDHVAPSLNETRAKYLPRVLDRQGVCPYIALLNRCPIGWAQSYVAVDVGDGMVGGRN